MNAIGPKVLQLLGSGQVLSAKEILLGLARAGEDLSQPSLSRLLTRLIDQGEVQRVGAGRAVKYSRNLAPSYFSVPPTRRPIKPYSFELLHDFDPQKSAIFSDLESKQLYAAGSLAPQPLSTSVRLVYKRFMIDLCWASSSLEGNTYSYLDTEVLLTYGQPATGKTEQETQMILNHKDAIQYLLADLGNLKIDLRTLKNTHALLSRGLIAKEYEGAIRTRSVGIGGSTYKPLDVPTVLLEQLEIFFSKLSQIRDPFDQSIFCLAFIAYLQPFDDVNKRTSRLIANIPLLKNNLCPLSFVEVDKRSYTLAILSFYELNRFQELRKCFSDGYIKSAEHLKAALTEA